MPDPVVLFALTGDVRRNSRAIKQIRVLMEMGCRVRVLSLDDGPAPSPFGTGVELHLLARPPGSGPRFFERIHRLFARTARSVRADVYHASDLYVLPALARAAARHGGKLVFDARELYPHVASTQGRPLVSLFWNAIQRRYIRRADAVFTVSASIAGWLSEHYGIARPPVLHNVPERQTVEPTDALRRLTGISDDTVVVVHQGSIQKDRGCGLLVDAMASVHGAALIFLGGGPLKPVLQDRVRREGLGERVRFLDPVPPDKLLGVTASADVGVTFLEDTCLNHRYALPNKLFEYLMAGVPVLASDLPEIREVVQRFDVGRVVNPGRPQTLIEVLQYMVDHPEARIRWAAHAPDVLETFNWTTASQRLRAAYEPLLEASSPSPPSS